MARRGARWCAGALAFLLAAGAARAADAAAMSPALESSAATTGVEAVGPAAMTPVPASPATDLAPAPRRGPHLLGLALDAGVPDGAGVSVIYRPWTFLRVAGGGLYNYAGYGVRGGVSVQPYWIVAPSLGVEVGHYFPANLNRRLSQYGTVGDDVAPLLEHVGYSFAQAQLGLEMGHPDWFVFFVRAGVGRLWLDVRGAEEVARRQSSTDVRITSMSDPAVRLGIPSVKLGFLVYFW
jgi:hypothetical protein